jgi:hypothetical protein
MSAQPQDIPHKPFIEPYPGLRYDERTFTIDAKEQNRLLTLCNIDPAVFGDKIDPVAFITLAIREGVRNGVSSAGAVNMAQTITQHRSLTLGEPITVNGEIKTVEEVARGKVAFSETWFSGADGQRAITSTRKSLRPDPAKAGVRGTNHKPVPVIGDVSVLKEVNRITLTPECVVSFTGPGNPVHTDPETAKRSGYRAPIMGGSQGMRYLSAEIWRRFKPRTLGLEIFFLRPIFWDDTFSVRVEETRDKWGAICLEKDNKVMVEARITELE